MTFADSDVGPSDSDVRLVAEPSDNPSDSDVRVAAATSEPSDSDVRPVQPVETPSDSDVKLAEADQPSSDSDARLPEPAPVPPDSASEGTEAEAVMVSEPDSDFELSDDVSNTDHEVSFEISLEPSSAEEDLIDLDEEALGDSDVAKPVDVTAGSPSESGVALDSPADSGISLEEPPSVLSEQTDAGVADLDAVLGSDFEEESSQQEESSENISLVPGEPVEPSGFDLEQEGGSDFDLDLSDDTAQIPLLDDDSQILDLEEEVPVDESAATAMAAPALEEEPVEEAGLEGGVMEMPGAMAGVAAPATEAVAAATPLDQAAAGVPLPRVAPEPDWPTWVVVVMSVACVFLLVTGIMMADLVRTMWGWENQSLYSSPILEFFRNTFLQ